MRRKELRLEFSVLNKATNLNILKFALKQEYCIVVSSKQTTGNFSLCSA